MNIELIIFLVLWVISTEIVFFKFTIDEFDTFIGSKLMSIFVGFVIIYILFGIPALFATGLGNIESAFGYIAYVWYYGSILVIGIFIGINYLIYKKVNKDE